MTHPEGRLQHALNSRLSERQYRHLVVQATIAEIPLSEALRRALDRDIEAQPRLEGDVEMSYAAMLHGVELEEAVEQLRSAGLT